LKNLRCKICMPHRKDITPETVDAIANFPPTWNGIDFVGVGIENSNLIKTRNDLLWGSTGSEPFDDSFDLYLFWDSDVVGTIKDFQFMYDLDLPVVFGLYPFAQGRGLEAFAVGGKYYDGFLGCTGMELYLPVNSGLVYTGADYWAGFGFTLIRKEVLKKVKYPWIEPRTIKTPDEYPRGSEVIFDDIGFCLKLVESGIDPVLDGRLNLRHIERKPMQMTAPKDDSGLDPKSLRAMKLIGQMAEKIELLQNELKNRK